MTVALPWQRASTLPLALWPVEPAHFRFRKKQVEVREVKFNLRILAVARIVPRACDLHAVARVVTVTAFFVSATFDCHPFSNMSISSAMNLRESSGLIALRRITDVAALYAVVSFKSYKKALAL